MMLEEQTPRRRPGRPRKPGDHIPKRDIRMGPIWDECYAAATEDGERFAAFVERALTRELQARARRIRRAQNTRRGARSTP